MIVGKAKNFTKYSTIPYNYENENLAEEKQW